MQKRFIEPDLTESPRFDSLLDEIFVVCPQCQSRARIAPSVPDGFLLFAPRRLTCEKCGLVKDWSGNSLSYSWWSASPVEPYFKLPLWFHTSCCGKALWFLNLRHMQLVEQYVRADLREKRQHPKYGWFNKSLYNRLPKFIKEAKHRDEILKAIGKLKNKA